MTLVPLTLDEAIKEAETKLANITNIEYHENTYYEMASTGREILEDMIKRLKQMKEFV